MEIDLNEKINDLEKRIEFQKEIIEIWRELYEKQLHLTMSYEKLCRDAINLNSSEQNIKTENKLINSIDNNQKQ